MKVRIVNNGKPGYLTEVTEAETGKKLDLQFTEAIIKVKDNIPYILLTSVFPEIDITGEAEIKHVCPQCGHEE